MVTPTLIDNLASTAPLVRLLAAAAVPDKLMILRIPPRSRCYKKYLYQCY